MVALWRPEAFFFFKIIIFAKLQGKESCRSWNFVFVSRICFSFFCFGFGVVFLVLLKGIFYFWPYLRAFWGLFFIFSRVLKQIQVLVLGFSEVFCFDFSDLFYRLLLDCVVWLAK